MNSGSLRTKIIYFFREDDSEDIQLLLANNSQSREGKVLQLKDSHHHHYTFETTSKLSISQLPYLTKLEVKCTDEGAKVILPAQEYRHIAQTLQELQNEEEEEEEEEEENNFEEDQEMEEEESQEEQGHQPQRYKSAGEHLIKQQYQESSINNPEHRGRGRPKGSKNKKTILKEALQLKEAPPIELKLSVSGVSKRGKGRPKGSKNKVKDFTHSVKIETGTQPLPYGKRGKGRPKGSKNKIKLPVPFMSEQADTQLIKKKGRPPGAKNRANSIESLPQQHQMEQQFVKTDIIRPEMDEKMKFNCCLRCEQYTLKHRIFNNQTNVEESIESLSNVFQDLGIQDKSNLVITAIRLGDWQSLQQLLSIVDKVCYYYSPPWRVDHLIDRYRFQTRTKKEGLSKTGKEGNLALLHDCFKRKQVWWKELSVQRIIENLPREQPDVENILQNLFNSDPFLKAQIFANIASVIRSGNYVASELLLRQLLFTPSRNPLNFSQEHYDLLIGNLPLINQLKKFNLIQHNSGNNFCSPIHAAAISPNSQFLRKLLQIFTDIINVEDSLGRRPIHYAALSNSSDNLSILFECGCDLKDYDKRKMTPLMLACFEGIYHNVEYILEKVRDTNYINFKSDEGYTALHYAILQNNIQCIELLINDPYVDLWALTKDKGDLFHLLAGTGNTEVMDLILKKQILPYTSHDKFKKTPPMIAIRNNNNDCLVKLIENGCRLEKVDSSQNTLLHYAAAYGNIEAILILKDRLEQTKNKKGLYPWELAIYKGHLGAAQLLEPDEALEFVEDPLYFALENIRGTPQYMECLRYIKDKMMADIQYQQRCSGNGYLHLICQISEEEYIKSRKEETYLTVSEIKEEFNWVQQELIAVFVNEEKLDGNQENYFGQTPLKLCIENNNLIGLQRLLTGRISFDVQPSSGSSILHCLSNLGCRGLEEMKFVQRKLKECSQSELKSNIKKIDHNGFDFLLFFIKNFTENAVAAFKKMVKKHQEHKKETKLKAHHEHQPEKKALEEFFKFEDKFIHVVDFLIELGCDINAQVADRRNEVSEQYKKWGIPHLIMQFPSLKILKYFKLKVRDFNSSNAHLMTPLHLFCKNIGKGNLMDIQLATPPLDYSGEHILEYLLANGLNPNCQDSHKALPIIYSALKGEYEFMMILRKYKSEVNFCTAQNQTPLIEIVKRSKMFTLEQVKNLLGAGIDPNFQDMDKRTALHHLVFHSTNFDSTTPDLAKLLLQQGAKINALDKYDRSPIFYCFCEMEEKVAGEPLQKVEILQVLMNHKEINLNLVDGYKRTILHYACQSNHFFSILYLLDKNINIEAKDYQENTPLAITLKTRNLDQAALLISKGVKYGFVQEEEGEKKSYFGYAFQKLSAGICFMLLDHGYPIQKALEEIPSSCFKETLIQKYIHK